MASFDAQSSPYFHTSICKPLCDTIDDFICASRIEPQLGAKILRNFVPSFKKAFAENMESVVTTKGRLQYYRSYEDKWWWVVQDYNVILWTGFEVEVLHVDKLGVVGYPTENVLNWKKGGGLKAVVKKARQKIEQKIEAEIRQEME